MKTIHTLLCVLLLSTFFISCSKDDEEDPAPAPITAQLFEDTGVMENSETLDFKIMFDQTFETIPATVDNEMEVSVRKGSRFATILFSPQDNQLFEENEMVTFELLESSENILFGTRRTTTVEILTNVKFYC